MVPRFLKELHWPVGIVAMMIAGIGVAFIYSASFRSGEDFAVKQMVWSAVALFVFFAAAYIGYRPFLNLSYLLYGVTILTLIYVLLFGTTRYGASRWIMLGPIVIQPSEICKIVTILALANFLSDRSSFAGQKKTLIGSMLLVGIPFILILKQPDLGSSLVFLPFFLAMVFVWGIRIRYLLFFFLTGLSAAPVAWQFLKPYQQKRILVFFNPSIDPIGASYTAIQSKIAVGSGSLFGKGWLHGTQTQLDFVPEHHTDFIFCVIGEEFGFVGSLILLGLFAVLIASAFHIMRHTTDMGARLIAAGITIFLVFQVFVNIGMTIGIAPITGLTLPLVSYGGSSLIMTFFALGLLVSIYKERSIF